MILISLFRPPLVTATLIVLECSTWRAKPSGMPGTVSRVLLPMMPRPSTSKLSRDFPLKYIWHYHPSAWCFVFIEHAFILSYSLSVILNQFYFDFLVLVVWKYFIVVSLLGPYGSFSSSKSTRKVSGTRTDGIKHYGNLCFYLHPHTCARSLV